MRLAWWVLAVAMAQTALLAESANGVTDENGNLFWGAYMAMFMVFLCCSVAIAQQVLARTRGRKMWLVAAAVLLLTAHAGTGAYFAARAGTTHGFPVYGTYVPVHVHGKAHR
jgi:hypothetical protein